MLSTRQASLDAADRRVAPSRRGFDPALRRPGLPERRRAATKVPWYLLWPDLHRLVIVNFRTRHSALSCPSGVVLLSVVSRPTAGGLYCWIVSSQTMRGTEGEIDRRRLVPFEAVA